MIVNGYKICPCSDLRKAELSYTNLAKSDLYRANLSQAMLAFSNMTNASLSMACLQKARLRFTNMMGAHMKNANMVGADMVGANMMSACLAYADLTKADLTNTNMFKADMRGTKLDGAILPDFQICPEEGAFVAWKKLLGRNICKLLIPADAKRTSSLVGRKCRASKAMVLEGRGYSMYNHMTVYEVGKEVHPDRYCDDIRIECSNGIHFFMTRKEAEEY